MIDGKHMAAIREVATTLRELKARLSGIGQELDDAMADAVVSLDMAENSIDAAQRHLAKVTGARTVPAEPSDGANLNARLAPPPTFITWRSVTHNAPIRPPQSSLGTNRGRDLRPPIAADR
jgi:hypothetical protein